MTNEIPRGAISRSKKGWYEPFITCWGSEEPSHFPRLSPGRFQL